MSTAVDTTIPVKHTDGLSTRRLNFLRFGYAFIGVGLAILRWPLLLQSLPVMKGVVVCMLTAMSLLAFLGLRYPVRMLPVLLFEAAWKLIWIAVVAVPQVVSGELDGESREVLVNCSLVVLVLAVIPWRYVWRRYVREAGDPWR